MEASRFEEARVSSRGLPRNRARPDLFESGPPGSKQNGRGDGMQTGAEALLPAEQYGAEEIPRWPTCRGLTRRETERFGGARWRKSSRVVRRTRYGCSSSEIRIGGLQTLVLRAFDCELAISDWGSDYGSLAGRSYFGH